jgi:hypothetical protein
LDVFDLRERVIDQYVEYVKSFYSIREPTTREFVADYLKAGRLWPEPLVQLNPSFQPGALAASARPTRWRWSRP